MTKRYLISADTKEMPGKVKLTFVSFETEVSMADEKFDARAFQLLDPQLPEARALRRILADK